MEQSSRAEALEGGSKTSSRRDSELGGPYPARRKPGDYNKAQWKPRVLAATAGVGLNSDRRNTGKQEEGTGDGPKPPRREDENSRPAEVRQQQVNSKRQHGRGQHAGARKIVEQIQIAEAKLRGMKDALREQKQELSDLSDVDPVAASGPVGALKEVTIASSIDGGGKSTSEDGRPGNGNAPMPIGKKELEVYETKIAFKKYFSFFFWERGMTTQMSWIWILVSHMALMWVIGLLFDYLGIFTLFPLTKVTYDWIMSVMHHVMTYLIDHYWASLVFLWLCLNRIVRFHLIFHLYIYWDRYPHPLIDYRADTIRLKKVRYLDPQVILCKYFRVSLESSWFFPIFWISWLDLFPSLELATQVSTSKNVSLVVDNHTVYAKIDRSTDVHQTVNLDHYQVATCKRIADDSKLLAYGWHCEYNWARRNANFPRPR